MSSEEDEVLIQQSVNSSKNIEKIMLQHIISRGFSSETKLFEFYKALLRENHFEDVQITMKGMDEMLRKVSASLSTFHMKLDVGISDATGLPNWVLVNTKLDEHSKLATSFSQADLAAFKKMVFCIAERGCGVPVVELNEVAGLDPEPGIQLIRRLYGQGWLDRVLDNKESADFVLGVRSLVELKGYLADSFDLPSCNACEKQVLRQDSCEGDGCELVFHKHCKLLYKACPNCKAVFNHSMS